MKASEDTFRTFCHVSEYGTTGHADLHRMIAASAILRHERVMRILDQVPR